MNWKRKRNETAPLLDEIGSSRFPDSFYAAFSVVFGDISSRKKLFVFLENLNNLMNWKKGGGKIERKEIIMLRSNGYLDVTRSCSYDSHHVKPRSRDHRISEKKKDQVVTIPERFHQAWHMLFLNLYNQEIIDFLEYIFFLVINKRKILTHYFLQKRVEKLIKEGKIIRRV